MRYPTFALLLVATLAACNPESRVVPPAADNRATMNPVAPPNTAAVEPQPRLELNEYEIRMPDTLAAGHHSFTVVNSGKQNHSLIIEGNGARTALPQQLTPRKQE